MKGSLAVSPGLNGNTGIQQDGNGLPELVWRLGVTYGYARSVRFQKQGGRHARLAQADDEHAFVRQIHC